ncbi:MAG: hypothetical protein ABSF94_10000 [Steroidobacteraceae bacterium]|jgi:hypothetical protein
MRGFAQSDCPGNGKLSSLAPAPETIMSTEAIWTTGPDLQTDPLIGEIALSRLRNIGAIRGEHGALARGAASLLDAKAAAEARAAANIAVWREYLPEDCIRAMISDGWHLTT